MRPRAAIEWLMDPLVLGGLLAAIAYDQSGGKPALLALTGLLLAALGILLVIRIKQLWKERRWS